MPPESPRASQPKETRGWEALPPTDLLAQQIQRAHCLARALGTAEPDAEDAAQEALLKAHRSHALFQGRSTFTAWVLTVVRNKVRDAKKSRRARMRSAEALALSTLGDSFAAPDAEELLERAQTKHSVWQAIDLLPPQFRRAVVLFDLEGHSYDEIAAIESISVGTVKSRLSRGRAVLRHTLRDSDDDSETGPFTPDNS